MLDTIYVRATHRCKVCEVEYVNDQQSTGSNVRGGLQPSRRAEFDKHCKDERSIGYECRFWRNPELAQTESIPEV